MISKRVGEILPVETSVIQQMWEAVPRGSMRQNLLNALVQRGVLHGQKQDEEPRQKMVAAAPKFPGIASRGV